MQWYYGFDFGSDSVRTVDASGEIGSEAAWAATRGDEANPFAWGDRAYAFLGRENKNVRLERCMRGGVPENPELMRKWVRRALSGADRSVLRRRRALIAVSREVAPGVREHMINTVLSEGMDMVGVVCMDILVTDLHKSIIDFSIGPGSFSFLLNKQGAIIASPDIKLDQKEFENIHDASHPASALADRILGGEVGVAARPDKKVFYAFAPISVADWTLCVHIPKALVFRPVHKINEHIQLAICLFLAAFVVIIIAVILLARHYSRTITLPLLRLKNDVRTISKGNLDQRAQVVTNDEIGDLAISFNNMAVSLDKYIKDLTAVTAEKERIGAELDVAKHIQSSMLPCIFPPYPDRKEFEIYATMQPAKEVGGDFYDFFMVDDEHLAIVMADVSGKGVPAALFMVIGKTLIKDHTTSSSDLGDVFSEVNNMLCESNSEGLFITAFEGVLNLRTGEFRYVNAGHEPPFIAHAGGRFAAQKIRPGFVLAGMEDIRYKSGSIQIEPGDKIFQYTDGVTEATDADNKLYGMERLENVLNANLGQSPNDILPAIKKDIDQFVGNAPQFDDITMLCLEYKERMK